jgi:hypothetical protein|tara:strand:+ start:1289 stop:1603 length:315 start_codon:yes stop_codon:yes gene_type:complete
MSLSEVPQEELSQETKVLLEENKEMQKLWREHSNLEETTLLLLETYALTFAWHHCGFPPGVRSESRQKMGEMPFGRQYINTTRRVNNRLAFELLLGPIPCPDQN